MTISSIPARLRRGTALVVLSSYAALVLVLAMHHHRHQVSPSPSYAVEHADGHGGHMHSASECPLQQYAVTAFHYLPTDNAAPAHLPESDHIAATTRMRADSGHLCSGLSRAPPALS